ncbi:MAG TPA: NAD(P)H-dependent oxidoreductase [Gemmatimonadaceae bacterium]
MPKTYDVVVLVGSLRAESLTLKIAKAAMALAPAHMRCRIEAIGDLSHYNEDLEKQPPETWTRFRDSVGRADAVLFATPEYNRSLPGLLKNALDVGSRPPGKSVWAGKPAAVISVTPYKLGAFGANHAIRQTFVFLDMPTMQQPEVYIGGAPELLNEDGSIRNDDTKKLLTNFMNTFERWIDKTRAIPKADDFTAFLERRKSIARDYVNGKAASLDEILPTEGAGSFFPPTGGIVTGAVEVKKRYDEDARSFAPGSTSDLHFSQSEAGSLAFWSGTQVADVILGGEERHMEIRITEVFRREGGEWKMIHRHADTAAEPKKG